MLDCTMGGILAATRCETHDRPEYVCDVQQGEEAPVRWNLCEVCMDILPTGYHIVLHVTQMPEHRPKTHDGVFVFGQS